MQVGKNTDSKIGNYLLRPKKTKTPKEVTNAFNEFIFISIFLLILILKMYLLNIY